MIIDSSFKALLDETRARYDESRGRRERQLELIGRGEVAQANPPALVEARLARIRGGRGASGASVERGLERVLGRNDLMSVRFLEDGWRQSQAVARLRIGQQGSGGGGYGTGFLVAPRLLLTNHHVLPSAEVAAISRAEFNYQLDLGGRLRPGHSFALDPAQLYLSDRDLDYALVAVDAAADLAAFGWIPLIEEQGKCLVGEWVNIIQHPHGEPKQLAIRENRVVDELERHLHYHTDTAPGSSGSPVFNDQWEVVALHRSGVPATDARGEILAIDAQPWQPYMGEHRIQWIANEGVRVSRLVAHLRGRATPGAAWVPLLDSLFNTPPPEAQGLPLAAVGSGAGPARRAATAPASTAPATGGEPGDTATWTIPLQLSVRLPWPRSEGTGPAVPPPAQPAASGPPALEEALRELAEAAERPYYDAEADGAEAERYYSAIDPEAEPAELSANLAELLRSSHQRPLSYSPSRHLYPWIDLHPDLRLRSIYSGQEFDPETIIREDLRIEADRNLRLQEFMVRERQASAEQITLELDRLEAALPYNCEHVVPQSWFERREPMRGDLHHLFTCEMRCNSFRSNCAYISFADPLEAVMDECGRREGRDFEPQRGHGAVARALLYFLLRYPGLVGDRPGEMPMERLPTLIGWHQQHPPDLYERHRNAAIQARQGNRNPLIDRPQWAAGIAFS
ncbi:MAG: trypsin-like peptidase domain-containing protein [Cyanobacteria bacterium J06638_7]